ncbi:hypothetical protein CJ030_MR7G014326 [Morella rubra]|uniref:Diacylglycerol O-acyltransferase 3, cytosolic n=1 Tax=Morella rubra TaxID=262757 RepID=A0A6A1V0U0_9ROSI|nr:hypothetical protein CJ030_MR7G014326 [Morella rubra]
MEVSGLAIQRVPCLSGAGTGTHPSKPSISGVSDAAEILMKQLQHLRQEEKELKKRRKEEDAKLKGTQMNTMLNCESSSSSSSESSDGECEDMVDKSRLRREPLAQPTQSALGESVLVSQENGKLTLPSRLTQEVNTTMAVGSENLRLENVVECCAETTTSCSSSSVSRSDRISLMTGGSAKRIEVCMGKKCEKSGAAALLEEFVRVVGVEGAVVGCKCLGKCRDGPNVRISNCGDDPQVEGVDVSVRTPTNPLCIGVGLDEVGVIVANFFGDEQKDLGLPAAV